MLAKKKFSIGLSALMVLLLVATTVAPCFAFTPDWTIKFSKNFSSTYTDWRSPLSNYPIVTSKWNTL